MAGKHLAQLNIGRLIADPDDVRVAEFMDNIDRINTAGKRMPGFVWIMEGSGGPGNVDTQGAIADDPRAISNLTVWEDVASLENFVFNTVHKQIYDRRAEWFEVMGKQHFVMWWIDKGETPTLDEALERLAYKEKHGDSDHAFGWSYLKEAKLFREKSCRPAAAE